MAQNDYVCPAVASSASTASGGIVIGAKVKVFGHDNAMLNGRVGTILQKNVAKSTFVVTRYE